MSWERDCVQWRPLHFSRKDLSARQKTQLTIFCNSAKANYLKIDLELHFISPQYPK